MNYSTLFFVLMGFATGASAGSDLVLFGQIDSQLRYRVKLIYAATRSIDSCQVEDQITGLWLPAEKSTFKDPVISRGRHELSFVVEDTDRSAPCGWQLSSLHLCGGLRSAGNADLSCFPLFKISPQGSRLGASMALVCDPRNWRCVDEHGNQPLREVSGLRNSLRLHISARKP